MENWLEKVTELLPELAKYYVNPDYSSDVYVESAMELWIDLSDWFYVAIDRDNQSMQDRIVEYFNICMSGKFGDINSDIQQAAMICMLCNMGLHPEYWDKLPQWFTKEQFEMYKNEFFYYLEDDQKPLMAKLYG